jgi:predicted TIM-barrel fold metal-dependent hydrolase
MRLPLLRACGGSGGQGGTDAQPPQGSHPWAGIARTAFDLISVRDYTFFFSGIAIRETHMSGNGRLSPAQVHARIKHPVIDADGHWIEWAPVFIEKIRKVGGDAVAEGFTRLGQQRNRARRMPAAERSRRRIAQPNFWVRQAENTLDRATAMMPRMLYDRLDEIGFNFAVVFPTFGLNLRVPGRELRLAVIRAYNTVVAEYFEKLGDRLTPAAVIPMHNPDEALAELEYVTSQLGTKVALFDSLMPRPISPAAARDPELRRFAVRYDALGIDSPHDYDPVWAKCVELGIPPTFHRPGIGQGFRMSPTNFAYNQIGQFAEAGHAIAKAIFLGGVTRRFPSLNFGFLEGGVGWAAQLFGDLIEVWEKRGAKGLERMDPSKLDRDLLMQMVEKYGYDDMAAALRARDGYPSQMGQDQTGQRTDLDDYAACKIARKEDWIDLYAKPFYFGCEADDRMIVTAFGKINPFGAQLNALFGSDIGHFDVVDMRDPLPEAYELVEDGHITEDNFRDFAFANAVRLWGTQNPRFFEGTAIAKEAAEVLNQAKAARAAAE